MTGLRVGGGGGGGKGERLMLWAWLTNETRNKVEDETPCSSYLLLLRRIIIVLYVTAPLAMYIKSETVGGRGVGGVGRGGGGGIKNR